MAGEYGQLVLSRGLLLGQRGQRDPYLREVGLLLQHVGLRSGAGPELALYDLELPFLQRNDFPRNDDLFAHRGQLNRGGGYVGGQREVACLELEVLAQRLRLQTLDRPTLAPEHVKHVRDADIRLE